MGRRDHGHFCLEGRKRYASVNSQNHSIISAMCMSSKTAVEITATTKFWTEKQVTLTKKLNNWALPKLSSCWFSFSKNQEEPRKLSYSVSIDSDRETRPKLVDSACHLQNYKKDLVHCHTPLSQGAKYLETLNVRGQV